MKFLTKLLFFCATFIFCANALAEGVKRCDNCVNPRLAAKTGAGDGLVVVVDYPKKQIFAFDVQVSDYELQLKSAVPTAVPANMRSLFDSHIAMAAVGPTIEVRPGSYLFPPAFNDGNAYDVVTSTSNRSYLETYIAEKYSRTPELGQSFGYGLTSVFLGFLEKYLSSSNGAATFIVYFSDGSKVVIKVTADSVHKGKYQPGESDDGRGNKIPDQAVANPATRTDYVSNYDFGTRDEQNEWLNAARMFGIPITGGGSGGNISSSCSMVGDVLTCTYVIY